MRVVTAIVVSAMLVVPLARTAHADTPVEQRLRVLEEQLRDAQREIKRLRGEVDQQKAIGQATQRQAEQAQQQAEQVQKDQAKTVETAKAFKLPDWTKAISLFGDFRLRYDGIFHQPSVAGTAVTARNRERIRGRVGLKYTYSDELSATIRIATGNPDDPISTNQTLSGAFSGKLVHLDWAYLTFAPGQTFGMRPGLLTINGGKFPNPIFRTDEMVFDEDLAPEGMTETVALLDKPFWRDLDQVKIHFLQWSFNEIANHEDGWMIGGQVNPQLHFGTTQVEAGLGQYFWLDSDAIAQAASSNKALVMTNEIEKDSTGKVVGYRGAFNQSNATLQATFPDVVPAQPLRVYGNYVYNWLAPTDAAHGWLVGARLGDVKKRGDWMANGFYEQIEREAAISAFAFSDFGTGGTNLEGPGLGLYYQLLDPLTVSARGTFTNYLERPAGSTNPTQIRVLLDAMVKF
ncbi:MAG: putative porin [Candidatus Binatia bacterium]